MKIKQEENGWFNLPLSNVWFVRVGDAFWDQNKWLCRVMGELERLLKCKIEFRDQTVTLRDLAGFSPVSYTTGEIPANSFQCAATFSLVSRQFGTNQRDSGEGSQCSIKTCFGPWLDSLYSFGPFLVIYAQKLPWKHFTRLHTFSNTKDKSYINIKHEKIHNLAQIT